MLKCICLQHKSVAYSNIHTRVGGCEEDALCWFASILFLLEIKINGLHVQHSSISCFHTAIRKHGGDVCLRTLFTFPAFEETIDKTSLGIQKLTHGDLYCTFTGRLTIHFFLCSARYSALFSYSITACRTGTCISSVVHLSLTSHRLHHHKKNCGKWESLFLNDVLPADCVRKCFFRFSHICF